jgi:hypothetical protein
VYVCVCSMGMCMCVCSMGMCMCVCVCSMGMCMCVCSMGMCMCVCSMGMCMCVCVYVVWGVNSKGPLTRRGGLRLKFKISRDRSHAAEAYGLSTDGGPRGTEVIFSDLIVKE